MTHDEKVNYIHLLEEQEKREKLNLLATMYAGAYPWQRKFIQATKDHTSSMLMASNRCIAGHMLIQVETEKGVESIPFLATLAEKDVRICYSVDGSIHSTDIFSAYFQGIFPTFRLYLSNGLFIDCSALHRVLDGAGNYRKIFQLMLHANVQRCYRTNEGFQDNYGEDDYQYDQQLLSRLDIDPALPPLSGDAHRHNLTASWQADEAERIDQHIQACQSDDLLSSQDARSHSSDLIDMFSSYVFLPSDELLLSLREEYGKYDRLLTSQPQSIGEGYLNKIPDYGEAYSNRIYFSSKVPLANDVSIIAWQEIGLQPCFDYSVPDHNNYIASGIVNHNCGKTRTGLTIDSYHLRGDYPDDWEGLTFEFPPMCWLLGYSGEKTRDLLQNKLFGRYEGGEFEGGLIPADMIVSCISMAGTSRAMREVRVKHINGISTCQFWSYSQGQGAMMGDEIDWFHIDEEPVDQTIVPQILTRALTGNRGKGGSGILTFTPENGKTQLVCKFMGEDIELEDDDNAVSYANSGMYLQGATWDECPHLSEDAKNKILVQYPAYQRKMRSLGIPLMGAGVIYEIDEDDLKVPAFEVPDHWFVINGMDFGWAHPQAHVQLVWDKDTDTFYLINAWKASKKQPFEAWQTVKPWCDNIPTAWPGDGLQTEKGSAKQQKDYYTEAGWDMLPERATWESGGDGVWAGLVELNNLMKNGRFKVVASLIDFFEEFRQYHTKTNKQTGKSDIVKIKDDLLDAVRYCYMMRRYAIRIMDRYPEYSHSNQTAYQSGRSSSTGY